jgi:hypothetical protein
MDESLHRKASGPWLTASLQLAHMRMLAYIYYRLELRCLLSVLSSYDDDDDA